jgi:predicted component of type VI protein secretion system
VERSERSLFPKERTTLRIVRRPEARYVAIAALFRRPAGRFSQVLSLPEEETVRNLCQQGDRSRAARPRLARLPIRVIGARLYEGEGR